MNCKHCGDRFRVLVDPTPEMRWAVREGYDSDSDWVRCGECLGPCTECGEPAIQEVDEEKYCPECCAGLVTMAMRAQGMLPRICDTEPAPAVEVAS